MRIDGSRRTTAVNSTFRRLRTIMVHSTAGLSRVVADSRLLNMKTLVPHSNFDFPVRSTFWIGGLVAQSVGSPQLATNLFKEGHNIGRFPRVRQATAGCLSKLFHARPDLEHVVKVVRVVSFVAAWHPCGVQVRIHGDEIEDDIAGFHCSQYSLKAGIIVSVNVSVHICIVLLKGNAVMNTVRKDHGSLATSG